MCVPSVCYKYSQIKVIKSQGHIITHIKNQGCSWRPLRLRYLLTNRLILGESIKEFRKMKASIKGSSLVRGIGRWADAKKEVPFKDKAAFLDETSSFGLIYDWQYPSRNILGSVETHKILELFQLTLNRSILHWSAHWFTVVLISQKF